MFSIHYFLKKILFPQYCLSCHQRDTPLCQKCLELIPIRITKTVHGNLYSLYCLSYGHALVKKIIWELKYKNNTELRKIIIEKLAPHIQMHLPTGPLVPLSVPYNKASDDRHRSFDHGKLLKQAWIQALHSYTWLHQDIAPWIKKRRKRLATTKSKSARREEIHNSFVLTDEIHTPPQSVTWILFDDVITTGATCQELYRIFSQHRREKLYCIILAH